MHRWQYFETAESWASPGVPEEPLVQGFRGPVVSYVGDGRYDDEKRRLNVNIGRALVGEWNEQTSGTYILSTDVNTSGTIHVDNGNVLDIVRSGIVVKVCESVLR